MDHVLPKPTQVEQDIGTMAADEWIKTWHLPGLPLVWFGGRRRKELAHQIAAALATGRHEERRKILERLDATCCDPKERW